MNIFKMLFLLFNNLIGLRNSPKKKKQTDKKDEIYHKYDMAASLNILSKPVKSNINKNTIKKIAGTPAAAKSLYVKPPVDGKSKIEHRILWL